VRGDCCGGLPSKFCSPRVICHGQHRFLGGGMGYLGFCYVESKSFEFRSEVSGGVGLVERSRCIFGQSS